MHFASHKSDEDMSEANKAGKCAGCEIIFKQIKNEEPPPIRYIGYLWCDHCYRRRLAKVSVKGADYGSDY